MVRIISRRLHAYLDYPVAIALMVLPFVLGIGMENAVAFGLSVGTGLAALVLTALTDHETGLLPVLPYVVHLSIDGIVGAVFIATPLVLGLTGLDAVYFLVIGATILSVVAGHKTDDVPFGQPAE